MSQISTACTAVRLNGAGWTRQLPAVLGGGTASATRRAASPSPKIGTGTNSAVQASRIVLDACAATSAGRAAGLASLVRGAGFPRLRYHASSSTGQSQFLEAGVSLSDVASDNAGAIARMVTREQTVLCCSCSALLRHRNGLRWTAASDALNQACRFDLFCKDIMVLSRHRRAVGRSLVMLPRLSRRPHLQLRCTAQLS